MVVIAANRDEDPARPSDPPGVLNESPRLVGGRDRRAGGTWLAVRERRAAVAMLNRRGVAGDAPGRPGAGAGVAVGRGAAGGDTLRSRGLLTLEVAKALADRTRSE